MKVFKISAFALIALALSMSSCQKNDILESPVKKGGDLDEPIIAGIGLNAILEPVYPGKLKLYQAETNLSLDSVETDSEGNFTFNVVEGSYYLELYDGEEVFINSSETLEVTDSTYVIVSP